MYRTCKKCGEVYDSEKWGEEMMWKLARCTKCGGREFSGVYQTSTVVSPTQSSDKQTKHGDFDFAVRVLWVFAWINFFCGIIGAVAISVADGMGIGFGISFLFGAILASVFLLVVCSIAENLIEIRKNTKSTNH